VNGEPLLPDVPDTEAYKAARGDPSIWLPAFEELCRRHGIDASDLYAERSGTNMVFRAGSGPWLKLFPPLWDEDFVRERTSLAAVAGDAELALPQLLHEGELEGWPYLVLSHLEGKAIGAIWPTLELAARCDLARQIGALLARLHAVDTNLCEPIREDWPAWATEQRAVCVARQQGYGLEPRWAEELAAHVAALPPLVDPEDPPVFLHADVTDEHVFVEQRAGRWCVTGLIDFGDAMVGDRLYDFAAPLVFLGQRQPRVQHALLEGYGWDPGGMAPTVIRRMVGWCLLHRWGRIPEYLPFTPGRRPQTLAELIEAIWSGAQP
jgi:hygromycin-B 7''-O-kinase